MNDSVIASMQTAIQGLAEERTKLNTAFGQLSETIKLLDPTVESVGDDGTLYYANGRAISAPVVLSQAPGVETPVEKVPPGPAPVTPDRAEHGSNLQIVRDAFDAGKWYSIKELVDSTGLSKQRVSESVRRLVNDHYAVARGQAGTQDRKYALAGTPEPAPLPVPPAPEPPPAPLPPPVPKPQPKPPADKPRREAGEWSPAQGVAGVYFGDPTKIVREKKPGSRGRLTTIPHWSERQSVVDAEIRMRKVFQFLVDNSPDPQYARAIGEALGHTHASVGGDVRVLVERGSIVEYRNYGYYEDPGPNGGGRPSHAYTVNVGAVFIDRDGNKDPSPSLVTIPPKQPTRKASPKR